MGERIFNFSPGPATLPLEVLEQASKDVINFDNSGIGICEISHRSKEFLRVATDAEKVLREPAEYSRQLQGSLSSGWCIQSILHDPHEPAWRQKKGHLS